MIFVSPSGCEEETEDEMESSRSRRREERGGPEGKADLLARQRPANYV